MADKYRKYSLNENETEILQKAINILCEVGNESCHEYPFQAACMLKDIKDGAGFTSSAVKNVDGTYNQLGNYRGWADVVKRKSYTNNLTK